MLRWLGTIPLILLPSLVTVVLFNLFSIARVSMLVASWFHTGISWSGIGTNILLLCHVSDPILQGASAGPSLLWLLRALTGPVS